jgi:hypothetical protein
MSDRMQDLVQRRFHSGALAGGKDDGGERAGRIHSFCPAISPPKLKALLCATLSTKGRT